MGTKKLLILIYLLFFVGENYAQDQKLVSIPNLADVKDSIEFKKKFTTIRDIVFYNKKQISTNYLDSLFNIGSDLKLLKEPGQVLRLKGVVQERKQKYRNAFNTYREALAYFEKIHYERGIAIIYNHMYIIKYHQGYLQESVEYLLEAKNGYEKINDTKWLGIAYNNLGLVHLNLKKYRLAEQEYLKAIKLAEKSGDTISVGLSMNNLVELYLVQKQTKKAKELLDKTIIYNKKNKNKRQIGYSYHQKAYFYVLKNQYRNAREYYDSILNLYECEDCNNLVLSAKQQLGLVEIHLTNYNRAEQLLAKTREIYCKIDSDKNLLNNYKLSFKLDSARGNLKGALDWQRKYKKLSDKQILEMSAKKIENSEARYKAELEQLKIIDEKARRERKTEAKLYRYKIVILIVIAGGVVSVLFLFWVMKNRKEREKLIINLYKSNQIKNKLFSMISQDLKNEVFELETSLNMMRNNTMIKEEFDQTIPLLVSRTHQTSILLHNLLSWSKSQMSELHVEPVTFDISKVISTVITFFKLKAKQKNIQLIDQLESVTLYADKDMILIVIQNLIANAIKFCKSGDSIVLMSVEKEHHSEISLTDTGIGIAPHNMIKLFTEEKFSTNGTQNELGIGIGLRVCKELIELNNGSIKVKSTLGKGSTFIISLPRVIV